MIAALDAGPAGFQAAAFDGKGRAVEGPALVDGDTVARWASALCSAAAPPSQAFQPGILLAGTAAPLLAERLGLVVSFDLAVAALGATADIAVFAQLAADREPGAPPVPLYLRAPDAKPQSPPLGPGHPSGYSPGRAT